LNVTETILPDCPTVPLFNVDYAIDGNRFTFWTRKSERVDLVREHGAVLGEELWRQSLRLQAEGYLFELQRVN
jgi:hypothetical protein